MLKKTGTQARHSFQEALVVGLHRDTATLLEGLEQLVVRSDLCHQKLVCPTEEERATFLSEHRSVLRWKGEATPFRVILQVASAGHLAEPFACVAFIDVGTLGQLLT